MPVAAVGENVAGVVLSGSLLVAVALAVLAGVLSFFSPCCLPLVPGYLSYVAGVTGADVSLDSGSVSGGVGSVGTSSGTAVAVLPLHQGSATRRLARRLSANVRGRTVLASVLFVSGFAAVFTSYGVVFGSFGALLIDYQQLLVRVLGVVTIGLGLIFTGWLWRLPLVDRTFRLRYRPRVGLAGAPLVGIMFGLGWTPCIGPTLAAVLTLATGTADAGRGAVLSLAYSLGLGVPFIVAAVSVQRVMASFGWARRHARGVMRTGGLMLVLLGVLQVTGVWTMLIAGLQGAVVGWQLPL